MKLNKHSSLSRNHYRRHVDRSREARGLAHIDVEPCIERDIILESDYIYEQNMKFALHRYRQKKITSAMFKRIQDFNMRDALRRAKVPLAKAREMTETSLFAAWDHCVGLAVAKASLP